MDPTIVFIHGAWMTPLGWEPFATYFEKKGNPSRPPLLLVAGGSDHIVPPQINRANHRMYAGRGRPVDFREFSGRGHWIIAQSGWEEVAGFIWEWLASMPPNDEPEAA